MQILRFKKISFLFVGGLLLAQFGGSGCQPMESVQFSNDSLGRDQSLTSPLQQKDEVIPAVVHADPENKGEAPAPQGAGQPSITDPVYDEAGNLKSFTGKGTGLGGETSTKVNNIQYDLSDPSNPKVLSFDAKGGSQGSDISLRNIQYDNSHRIISYDYTDKRQGIETQGHRYDAIYEPRFGEVIDYREVKKDSSGITTTTHFEQELNDLGLPARSSRRIHEEGEIVQPGGTITLPCRDTATEVFDMVYDSETHRLTEYKVKTTGADGTLHISFMKGSAYNTLDGEFFILPDDLPKDTSWWEIVKWLWEKRKKKNEAEEAEKKEEEERKEILEYQRAVREMDDPLNMAKKSLSSAESWLRDCQKELEAAQKAAEALQGNSEAQKKAERGVEFDKDSCERAEQKVKEAQAELDYQEALQKARKDKGLR